MIWTVSYRGPRRWIADYIASSQTQKVGEAGPVGWSKLSFAALLRELTWSLLLLQHPTRYVRQALSLFASIL